VASATVAVTAVSTRKTIPSPRALKLLGDDAAAYAWPRHTFWHFGCCSAIRPTAGNYFGLKKSEQK